MAYTRRSFAGTLFGFLVFILVAPFSRFRNGLSAAPSLAPVPPESVPPPSPSAQLVAVEPCSGYDPDRVYNTVKKALKSINFTIQPGKKVLLKPNIMAQNTPDQAASTHPAVVGALCRLFREQGCEVSIGDSSAFYQGGATRRGLETTGMAEVAKAYGAKLLPFETTTLRKITTGRVLNPLYVTNAVFEHDLVVDVPKLKVHRLARYSGAIKNLYGCVVGGTKQIYHKLFMDRPDYQEFWGKPLVDVYESIMPGLTVMDAVVGLDKDGPAANGEPRKTGMILASENGAALDVVVCRMIRFDPEWVPAVREAIQRGLTSVYLAQAVGEVPEIPYTKLPDLERKTGLSKKWDDYSFKQFLVEPRVNRAKCDQCGECVKKCAVQAISKSGKGGVDFDYKACISCYCCEEYCPKKAIFLHGGAVNHVMRGIRQIIKL